MGAALDREIAALLEAASERAEREVDPERADLVRRILVTGLRLLGDPASIGDLRLIHHSMKEMRHALRVFAPYEAVRKVSVFGSARTEPGTADWRQAERFAEAMVRAGWMVITGAGDGIMQAAQGGAGRESSFGVNIRLPFEQVANEVIAGDPKCIHFRYFFTRKVAFVKNSHAIALFPGGFGTHDEGFEALTLIQTGKSEILPVVFVDEPGGSYWHEWDAYVRSHLQARSLIRDDDLALYRVTDDVDEAVAEIRSFYRNYHSSRFVRQTLVLRVRQAPDEEQLETLNQDFADVVRNGGIRVRDAFPEEGGDAPGLPRIAFEMDRRKAGRVRQLIDRLNGFASDGEPVQDASSRQIVSLEPPEDAVRDEEEA